ncbi:MAG TPA: glycosyltransferase family 2 protein [Paludibacteraceae bacterium]|nr:glycosyltransferase family 2 protein [Paludibacteraceae bacterium]
MKIVVVIVTYNGMYWLDKCLGSIRLSTVPLHTLVIDNLSTDNTVAHIQQNYPEVELIKNSYNAGFGQANNMGLRKAIEYDADYVFLLNQDAWIEPTTCQVLVQEHQKKNSIGIISPIHLTGNATELDKNFASYIPYLSLAEVKQLDKSFSVPFVNAAAWMMTRAVIDKVGGFDPLFTHYGEDRDYCQRVKFHGFEIAVVPTVSICHDRKYSANNSYRKQTNLLYSIGLASLKDIRIPFSVAIATYKKNRFKKSIKALLKGDIKRVWNEWTVVHQLLKMKGAIDTSRTMSIKTKMPYL